MDAGASRGWPMDKSFHLLKATKSFDFCRFNFINISNIPFIRTHHSLITKKSIDRVVSPFDGFSTGTLFHARLPYSLPARLPALLRPRLKLNYMIAYLLYYKFDNQSYSVLDSQLSAIFNDRLPT